MIDQFLFRKFVLNCKSGRLSNFWWFKLSCCISFDIIDPFLWNCIWKGKKWLQIVWKMLTFKQLIYQCGGNVSLKSTWYLILINAPNQYWGWTPTLLMIFQTFDIFHEHFRNLSKCILFKFCLCEQFWNMQDISLTDKFCGKFMFKK